jgi:Zn-dependent peptidase ImmA (M78 family)/DNA-binding XRE family transcriptional regulator
MITEFEFNPSRLTLARKRRGMTMTKLAAKVELELRSISAYEKGEYRPEEGNLEKIARALGFPQTFFRGPDLDEPTPDSASFRALKRMTAGQRDTALGSGALALLFNSWVEKRFTLPSPALPDLSQERDPEAAAEQLRRDWGLGELPIKNVVHLLESKGVRVFSLAIDAAEVDAFSMWRQTTPFVFLNTAKSAEHGRFDAAHELGHLVMHRHGAPQGQNAEREANAFASALLMPRSTVLAVAPRFTTVERLVDLKKIWNVSVAALAYRLHALDLISDWQYRSVAIELSRRGYRTEEPDPAPRETSQIFAKVSRALREDGISKEAIATDLSIPAREIEQLVFGLLVTGLTSVPGAAVKVEPGPRHPKTLHLIK